MFHYYKFITYSIPYSTTDISAVLIGPSLFLGKFNHRILTYYLSGKPINIPLTSTEELQLLSCFLTWHGLPPANKLPTDDFNKLFASDNPLSSSFKSFGKVYGTFAKHGFSVSMCKTLLKMSSGQKT